MKPFVIQLAKDRTALLAVALLVGMLITETGQALLLLFGLAIMVVAMRLYDDPPRWLLRSPLRRWLKR